MSLTLLSSRPDANSDVYRQEEADIQRLKAEINELQIKISSQSSIVDKSEQNTQNMKTIEDIFNQEDEENELLKELTKRTAQNRIQLWPDTRERRDPRDILTYGSESQGNQSSEHYDASTQYSQRLTTDIDNIQNTSQPFKNDVESPKLIKQQLEPLSNIQSDQIIQEKTNVIEKNQNDFNYSTSHQVHNNDSQLILEQNNNTDQDLMYEENLQGDESENKKESICLSRSKSIEHIVDGENTSFEIQKQENQANGNISDETRNVVNGQNNEKIKLHLPEYIDNDKNNEAGEGNNEDSTPSTVVQTITEDDELLYNHTISDLEQQNSALTNEVLSQKNQIAELQKEITMLKQKLDICHQKEQQFITLTQEMADCITNIYQEVPKIIKQVQQLQDQLFVAYGMKKDQQMQSK